MKTLPTILLSFDVEEFDLPVEYGFDISLSEQFTVGKKGLDVIEQVISAHCIKTTIFTTGRFALEYAETVKRLSAVHEIASHTFNHSVFEDKDLVRSKIILEKITGKPVCGLRMPRMKQADMKKVKDAGYLYDSSINPTWIPGKYDHRNKPRTLFIQEDMIRLPVSVTPNFRIPLFWLSFKNFPYFIYKKLALQTLKKDGYLSLYFHPWEFTPLTKFSLPAYITHYSGDRAADRLMQLITDLGKHARFDSIENYIRNEMKHGQDGWPQT